VLKDFFLGALDPWAFDPKVLYDAMSSRWFAIAVSLIDRPAGQLDEGRLHVAVSLTGDPLASWNIYYIFFSNVFPDYPAIGLTNDKVTLSSNLFTIQPFGSYVGERTLVLEKAALLAGLVPIAFKFPVRNDRFTVRPAQALSAVNDQYLVMRGFSASEYCGPTLATTLAIIRITGTPDGNDVTESAVNLSILPQKNPPQDMLQANNTPFFVDRMPLTGCCLAGRPPLDLSHYRLQPPGRCDYAGLCPPYRGEHRHQQC